MAALRELLASFEVRVPGKEQIGQTDREVNKLAADATRAGAALAKAGKQIGAGLGVATAIPGPKAFQANDLKASLPVQADAPESAKVPDARGWARFAAGARSAGTAVLSTWRNLAEGETLLNRLQRNWMNVAAVGLAAHGASQGIQALAGAMDELGDRSDRLGIPTDELQKLDYLAKMADVSSQGLNSGLRVLYKNLTAAGDGSKSAKELFDALGVSYEGPLASAPDLLRQIAGSISSVQDPARRAGLAMQVFGRGGMDLLPLLQKSEEELGGLEARFAGLGGAAFSKEMIESAGEFDDSLKDLSLITDRTKAALFAGLIPALTRAVGWFGRASQALARMNQNGAVLKIAMVGLSVYALAKLPMIAASLWAMVTPVTITAVGIFALLMAVQDLYTFFQGGKSIFGEYFAGPLIDSITDLLTVLDLLVSKAKEAFAILGSFAPQTSGGPGMMPGVQDTSGQRAGISEAARKEQDQILTENTDDKRVARARLSAQNAGLLGGLAKTYDQAVNPVATAGPYRQGVTTLNDSSQTVFNVQTIDQAGPKAAEEKAKRQAKLLDLSKRNAQAALVEAVE